MFEAHHEPWDAWFENRVYPSPDGLSIYFTDVSVRKRAETALQLSESRYRLAASGGQVWDWNVVDGRVDFPAGFWQQLGCKVPPAPETSARFEARLHPEDAPVWRQSVRDHLARRAPYVLEYRARHASGEWRWFHTQGQAVWDASGRATYMAGTTFDITERKRAEAALRESEAFRRSVFEQLGDGVLLVDFEQRLLDVNPQALRMLSYQRDDPSKLRVHDLLPTAEHERADSEVRKVMAGQIHRGEWNFKRKTAASCRSRPARAIDAKLRRCTTASDRHWPRPG